MQTFLDKLGLIGASNGNIRLKLNWKSIADYKGKPKSAMLWDHGSDAKTVIKQAKKFRRKHRTLDDKELLERYLADAFQDAFPKAGEVSGLGPLTVIPTYPKVKSPRAV
jgi:hypothetical protein